MDTKLRLLHLLALPGGLCFRRVSGTREAIMDDVEFQLLVLLGLGDQTGEEMWNALETLAAEDRLDVRHDDVKDETWLGLKLNPSDEELGEQAAGDLERMADLMGRIASSAEGPEPKLVTLPDGSLTTILYIGQGAEHIVLAASTPAGADLLRQLHTIATSVRT